MGDANDLQMREKKKRKRKKFSYVCRWCKRKNGY